MYNEQKCLTVLETRRLTCQATCLVLRLLIGSTFSRGEEDHILAWQKAERGTLSAQDPSARSLTPCRGRSPLKHSTCSNIPAIGEASNPVFLSHTSPGFMARRDCWVCSLLLIAEIPLPTLWPKSHLQTWLLCSLPLAAVFFWSAATYKT